MQTHFSVSWARLQSNHHQEFTWRIL